MQLDAGDSPKLPGSLLGKGFGCCMSQVKQSPGLLSYSYAALKQWAKIIISRINFPKSFNLCMSSILSLEFKS